MSSFYKRLSQILEILPLILLVTFVEVIIAFATGFLVMIMLLPKLEQHPYIILGISIMIAVIVQVWIIFNHKIRSYIKARSTE